MLSSSRACAQRRRWILAALFAAQGAAMPAGLFAAEAGLRPAGRSLLSQFTSQAELPPIVSPSAAQRPRPNQSKAQQARQAQPAQSDTASQPTGRLARMQAAAAEMLGGGATNTAGDADASPRPQSNPWMQEIDPSVRSLAVPPATPRADSAAAVEPVRYHARLEDKVSTIVRVQTDDAEAEPATTVAPVLSEEPEENRTTKAENPTARSSIGKPAGLLPGHLPRMLGIQQVSGTSSRRSFQSPAKQSAAQAAEPTPTAAAPTSEESARVDCHRLEEKLCELFPDREIQIVIGRDHASVAGVDTEIVAIIRKPQQHHTVQPAVEATSVLKAPSAGSRYFAR